MTILNEGAKMMGHVSKFQLLSVGSQDTLNPKEAEDVEG